MSDGFTGFPPEAFPFFADLAKNNNRDWFQAHKHIYEGACREPMKALMAALDPPLVAGRLSRINRDMRFARDREPYKSHLAAGVRGNYVSLSAQGLYVGGGIYRPEPPTLRRLREAIAADASGKALQKIVGALRRQGYMVSTHEASAKPPRGYDVDHPRIDLLKMKDIHAGRLFEPAAWLSTPKAAGRVAKAMKDLEPFNGWIKKHMAGGQVGR